MKKRIFQKQPMMRRVLYSLIPIWIFAIGNYGWRVFVAVLLSIFVSTFVEYLFERKKDKPISEAALVSGMLLGLILPPAIPFWILIVASVFAMIFAKEAFGGFGRNIFNPAMVGRAFVYVSFPAATSQMWTPPSSTWGVGFGSWLSSTEIITSATPLNVIRYGDGGVSRLGMFFGNISGSAGETAKWLIIVAAIYLIFTKTASWKIIVSSISSAFVMATILFITKLSNLDPFTSIIGGSILFGTVFMATDPISAPRKDLARIYYGVVIGTLTIVIRTFSLFGAGFMFALLIGNVFASLLDFFVSYKKVKA